MRFFTNADAGGGHHGVVVFADGEAAGEVLGLGVEGVRGGVDGVGGPDGTGGDPFFEVGFFLSGKGVAVLGHFVFSDDLPDHAFIGVAGADDVRVGEGGEFLGEVEVAFDGGGVVALEAVAREEGLDVGDKKGLAAEAGFFGFREDGFGLGSFFEEGLDVVCGKGTIVERDVVDGAEPGAILGELVSEGEEIGVVPVVKIAFDGGVGGDSAV